MNSQRVIRLAVFWLLICAITTGVCLLIFTRTGYEIRNNPRAVVHHFLVWIQTHPCHAGASFFGLYVLMTLLMLPVWTLQMMCGYALSRIMGTMPGLIVSIAICQIAATISAMIAFHFSRWLAADWFHKKVESKMHKLRTMDEKLGHNGFLLVMAVRVMHVLPFAISNYAFGLLSITAVDVLIGTILGGIPGVLLYVGLGAHPHIFWDWRFVTAMILINLILIVPVALRYLKPQWFKKIGVE
jgi:uncharacterized membrane protein YdjX (TVP38/TMEM64 family)